MPIKKASHCAYDFDCAYDIHYHFIFSVKYRRAVLEPPVVTELVRISQEICERYEISVECLGADKDHVHLLCSAHPKMAPGQVARIYKSLTALLVPHRSVCPLDFTVGPQGKADFMPRAGRSNSQSVGLGCGGAIVGAFIAGNLVDFLGHNELGADERVGLAYAYYLGAPPGAYIGIRVVPLLAAGWKKLRDAKRKPPAA